MLAQQKKANTDRATSLGAGGDEAGKLFKHDDDEKKKAAPTVQKPSKEDIENAKVLKQQQAMLAQQKKANTDRARSQGDGEDEAGKLFKHDDDGKKKAAPTVKKPSKEDIENAKVLKQQQAMLAQQK